MKTLLVIVGPTASGKTALALNLANHFHTEIINADSRQFYKGMDIGTAKPTSKELASIKHHFVDFISPEENYTVGNFELDALLRLDNIFQQKEIAILAGGSGLYIQAVCEGLDKLPSADPELRRQLQNKLEESGLGTLQEELQNLDPEYYKVVDIQNPHRLIRAIEVCLLSGKKYSELRKSSRKNRPFQILKIGILPKRELMYENINKRVDEMINLGLVDEVRKFIPFKHLNALKTVGYQELFPYFDQKISLDEAVSEIKLNTRRYAKRQLTWFKKDPDIHWFPPGSEKEILSFIKQQPGIED